MSDTALAEIRPDGRVALPAAHAAAAVRRFFEWHGIDDARLDAASAAEWIVDLPDTAVARRVLARVLRKGALGRVRLEGGRQRLTQPSGTLALNSRSARRLKHALEDVLPRQPNGLPHPWNTPAAATAPFGRTPDADDVVSGEEMPLPPVRLSDGGGVSDEVIRADFERLRIALGLASFPLTIRRGAVHKRGFVTGRVHIRDGAAVQMVLTTCPNADRAEAAATLVHEFAHLQAVGAGHGEAFKAAVVAIAEQIWGARHFVPARQALDAPYAVLDGWIATGVRARLGDAPAPVSVRPEEARIITTVRRIQKLRALAANQLGRPEGVLAEAKANDLIVTHGLGDHRVALPGDLGEALCDRWLLIGKRAPWKASVAFTIAKVCDVFALQSTQYGGMHLFGRYADVVTAEHLYGVATEGIARRCAAHLKAWRATGGRRRVVSERAAFLNSAAHGLRAAVAGAVDAGSPRLGVAEAFAFEEHEKRGMGWRGGGRRTFRYSAEGFAAGQAVRLTQGVDGRSAGRLLE